jgi:DNA invertase Pin-like site-specific DNA recombinase
MHPQVTTFAPEERAAWLAGVPLVGRLPATLETSQAIAFTRVSDAILESRPDQLEAIERDAAKQGVPVTLHLGGEHSRWDAAAPDYVELDAAIDSGQYSHLWTFKADRLGGDEADFIKMVRKAMRKGMHVHDTVIGEITDDMVGLLGLISHMEIKAVSQRTIMRLEALAERGHKLGSVPIGYRWGCNRRPCKCEKHGHPETDPVAAPVVAELFERYDGGESLHSCWQWFNTTLGLRKDRLSIERILRNPYYCGLNINCRVRHSMVLTGGKARARPKEEWKVTMHDKPLVDKETFDRVQARLGRGDRRERAHLNQRTRHSLSSLLWCASCQRRLSAHRTGGNSWVWRCPVCNKTRGAARIERGVRSCLDGIPVPAEQAGARYASRVQDERDGLTVAVQAIDGELAKLAKRRVQLRLQQADTDMTIEELRELLAITAQEQGRLTRERERLQQQQTALPAHADLAREIAARLRGLERWTDGLDRQPIEQQQEMYRQCVGRAVIDFEAGTLQVEYTPAIAGWCGRASDTVSLPSQNTQQAVGGR